MRQKRDQINKIWYEKEVTTDTEDAQRFNMNTLWQQSDNLKEMEKFLEMYTLTGRYRKYEMINY